MFCLFEAHKVEFLEFDDTTGVFIERCIIFAVDLFFPDLAVVFLCLLVFKATKCVFPQF